MSDLALTLIDDITQLEQLAPEWEELAAAGGDGALFRGPRWLLPWLRAYGTAMEAVPHVIVARAEGKLVGLAPLYERTARLGPGVKSRELRLLGDAGPRPPSLDLLASPGFDERVARAVADFLSTTTRHWDVLDLAPLRDPSRVRAYLAERLDSAGRKVESQEAGTTIAISLGAAGEELAQHGVKPTVYDHDAQSIEKGLARLRRLSRVEWAARDEHSPIAEPEATRFLHDVAMEATPRGAARVVMLDDEFGMAIAGAFVLDEGQRAICIALATDPERAGAGAKLLTAEAAAAVGRGMRSLDIVLGAGDPEPPPLPVSHRRSLRLRAFNGTTAGTVARTASSLRRRAEAAREAPGAAAAGARAAWTKIRHAAANVATYERLHLYRGELWTRGVEAPEGLTCEQITEADLDAMPAQERAHLIERLELDETYCRDKWRRGDVVVLARLAGVPAGIAWCARAAVLVPEIGRDVRPGPYECYIHDVFVAPDARGKNVAPAMLEDLAKRLRQRDVYRAWALIETTNAASTRAFEKAAYVAVADVIYARMAVVDKLVLRPPDPEGKRLLGIS